MLETLETVKNVQSNMYAKYGLKIENFFPEEESSEYHAHTFTLKNKNGLFRIAKKTPAKTGWFVTIWKRGADNIIVPYDRTDAIDFVVIAVSDNKNVGEFIFPKTILLKKNIFSENAKEGKRAIRVYTPWDKTTSAQAAKTQKWQSQFFVDLGSSNSESTLAIKNLYSM
ncbi:MAG: hypothetical protein EKK63_18210 [Acinetobacter sp.]|uniref:MepB family protein n=1 Tax=Acinetobacter sp. TaxID=472 RepID=UPI000FB0DC64|nr:MepB family protein [Acinetobacter sp.]RUP36165.1 MAG: hypothetical protein EKK63_18210 [Acinetobacter sp.]